MKTIAVFYGGKSVEHDISVITALQTMKGLSKYKVLPVYIRSDGRFVTGSNLPDPAVYLKFDKRAKDVKDVGMAFGKSGLNIISKNKIKDFVKVDCALVCCHGHGGEDGSLQGALELCNMPYTSCDVLSSAATLDKVLSKIILKAAHIPSPAYVQFNKCEYAAEKCRFHLKIEHDLGMPCIVKPARLGSSVGISICENVQMLEAAIENALLFDEKIIVEKYIENAREFCCAALKVGERLVISKVQEVYKDKIYSFDDKYIRQKPRGKSQIPLSLEKKIKKMTADAYHALGCDGIVRIDFLYQERSGKLLLNEPNSIPGSLAFNLFNLPVEDLLAALISQAILKHQKGQEIQYTFSSEAIENYIRLAGQTKSK